MSVEGPIDVAAPVSGEQSTLGKVEALLKSGPEPAAGQVDTPETEHKAEPEREPITVKSLAERLEIEPDELYSQLKVAFDDGEKISLSELKDHYQSREAKSRELTEARANWQADQIRTERELTAILAAIDPRKVDPQLVQVYESRRKDYESREREQVLRTIPEWSDAKVEQADLAAITEAIKPYGKTKAHLEGIPDAGWRRLLRDFVKLQAKAKAAEKRAEPKRAAAPVAGKPLTAAQAWGREKAAVTSGRKTALAAVEKLVTDSLLPTGGNLRRR